MSEYILNPNILFRAYKNRYYAIDVEKFRNCMFIELSEKLFAKLIQLKSIKITNHNFSEDILSLLIVNGLIINTNDKIINCIKYYQRNYYDHDGNYLHSPIVVSLQPTFACNYNCMFCYNEKDWHKKYQQNKNISWAYKIIDQMAELGVPWLDIFGGEPFLLGKELVYLLEYINSLPIDTAVPCNGALLNKEIIKYISRFNQKKFFLSVSIHSFDLKKYCQLCGTTEESYRKVLKNIEMLSDYDVNYALNSVVLPNYTENDIISFLERSNELNAPQVTFMFYWETGKGAMNVGTTGKVHDYIQLTKFARRYALDNFSSMRVSVEGPYSWVIEENEIIEDPLLESICECQVGTARLDFLPNGDAVPCVLLADMQKYYLGNINEVPLSILWKNSLSLKRLDNPESCVSCKYLKSCKGGCVAFREKNQDRLDRRCPLL